MWKKWDWLIIALAIWGAATLAIAIQGALHPFTHTVYDIYATASRSWWDGGDMYVFKREWYRYSPIFAIALSPLAMLPEGIGTAIWKPLNAAVFLAGIWVWMRQVLPPGQSRTVCGLTLLLAFPGSMHSFHIGQANLMMMGLVFFGLAAATKNRWWLAAGLIAGATLIKGYPFALAMLLSVIYFRQFSWRFLLLLAVGLLLPFAFQHPDRVIAQNKSWFHHLALSGGDLNRDRQRGIDNLLEVCGYPISTDLYLALGVLAGGAVLALCIVHAWQTTDIRERLNRMSILFWLWVVLFGQATEPCTYVVVAPFGAWLVVDAFARRAPWWSRIMPWVGLILCGPAATDIVGPLGRKFTGENGIQQIGALILLAYVFIPTRIPQPVSVVKEELKHSTFDPPPPLAVH